MHQPQRENECIDHVSLATLDAVSEKGLRYSAVSKSLGTGGVCYSYELDARSEQDQKKASVKCEAKQIVSQLSRGIKKQGKDQAQDAGDFQLQYAIVFAGADQGASTGPAHHDHNHRGGFGDSSTYHGIFIRQPFRECESFEFGRGSARGVRGIIDPCEESNPYRLTSLEDLDEKAKQKVKSTSAVASVASAATSATSVHDSSQILDSSNINLSHISQDSVSELRSVRYS